jgi:2-polyprenyl-3-methyl-5-hydroxy-6-metoxy-1,4-benzoquinol methylase
VLDFGGGTHDVDTVDGLMMVLSPWAVRNLRFDDARFTGFHGYDADFCFQARRAGRRVVVDDIDVIHHTKGGYGDEQAFRRSDDAWRAKWITSRDSDPGAAGVRSGTITGDLGVYYEGSRPDLRALVPVGAQRVLDVGCGAGSLGAVLKQERGIEVAGIELFPQAAEIAEGRLDHLVREDLDRVETIPFPDGHFDAIVFGDVLEHLRDPQRLLRALRRYLADDGVVICSIPNVKHWSVVFPLLVKDRWEYADSGLLDRTHVHFFTLHEIDAMLRAAGFAPREVDVEEIPLPAQLAPLADVVARLGGDPTETAARLGAYQYRVIATLAKDGGEPVD